MKKTIFKVLVDFSMLEPFYSGFGQYSFYLGKALSEIAKKDDRIQFTFIVPPSFVGEFEPHIKIITHSRILKRLPSFIKSLIFRKYDLIHLTTQNSRYLSPKIPTVVTIHDLDFVEEDIFNFPTKQSKKIGKMLQYSELITAISEYTANELKDRFNAHQLPMEVIYNGVKNHSMPIIHSKIISPKAKFLFSIGAFSGKKNFRVLVEMLAELPDYQLVIAGKNQTEYAQKIRQSIQEKKLENRIILAGEISEEDKHFLYQHCTAFVFPSILEGFGLPVIEAMHYGKPVFLSTLSSLPEVGGKEAYYWESFEPTEMKDVFIQKMTEYQQDPQKPSQIKQHASQFTWEKASKEYFEAYLKVLTLR